MKTSNLKTITIIFCLSILFIFWQNCSKSISFKDASLGPDMQDGDLEQFVIVEDANSNNINDDNNQVSDDTIVDNEFLYDEGTNDDNNNNNNDNDNISENDESNVVDNNVDSDSGDASNDEFTTKRICNRTDILDLYLSIKYISLDSKRSIIAVNELNEDLISIFAFEEGIKFTVPNYINEDYIETNQIRIVLNPLKNILVDVNNKEYQVMTPSAQESGIKIFFKNRKLFKGQTYILKAQLKNISQNKEKGDNNLICKLSPSWEKVSIEEFSN